MNTPDRRATFQGGGAMIALLLLLPAFGEDLSLGEDVRFVEDLGLQRGGTAWTMDDGFLFPVRLDDALVGWVAVGSGEQRATFEAPWQAEAFANAWAVAGEPVSASVVDDQAWGEPVQVVLALSADPELSAPVAALEEVVRERDAVGYVDDEGIFNVVVTPWDLDRARRQAREALARRVPELADAGLDPVAAIHLDRSSAGEDRWVVDVRTERSWAPLSEVGTALPMPRWLTTVHDPHGGVSSDLTRASVLVGRAPGGTPRVQVVASEPRTAATGVRVTGAQANAMVSLESGGQSLRVEVEQQLTLVADSPTGVVTLQLPTTAEDAFHGSTPMARGFDGWTVETVDGVPLEPLGLTFGVPEAVHTRDTELHTESFRLPGVLQVGQSLTLRVMHTDRWRSSHTLHVPDWAAVLQRDAIRCPQDAFGAGMLCSPPSKPELVELGRVSAARPVLASVPGRPAHPVELRVGTLLPGGWNIAVGGERTEHVERGDARWAVARADSRTLVTVAKDVGARAHPAMGMPAIELLGHGPEQPGIPAYLRSILNFYRAVLPEGHLPELDLIRAADVPVATNELDPRGGRPLPAVEAARGQVVVYGQRELGDAGPGSHEHWIRTHAPKVVERGVAGAVASQYVLEVPVAGRDAWVVEALPAYLRDRFTLEAWGPDTVEVWRTLERARSEAELSASGLAPLAPGRPWTELAGARWLSALHARYGERGVMRGLEAYLAGDDRSTDALTAALSEGVGRDVSGWTDFWVRGGVRPSVTARWTVDGDGQLVVDLEADTPHGSFEVPLVVEGRRTRMVVWAEVADGTGSLTTPLRRKPTRVQVDPEGWLPLRGRTSVRYSADPTTSTTSTTSSTGSPLRLSSKTSVSASSSSW